MRSPTAPFPVIDEQRLPGSSLALPLRFRAAHGLIHARLAYT
jgi:hypothetical protein